MLQPVFFILSLFMT